LDIPQSTYKFISNKTCPYCQSKIKDSSGFIICSQCGTPHHKECWEENGGCTTYGCTNNPTSGIKFNLPPENIGERTIDEVRDELRKDKIRSIRCPACKNEIEENSIYCKFCGYNLREKKFDKAKQEFYEVYKNKYKAKLSSVRKRFFLTLISVTLLIICLGTVSYFAIEKVSEILNSPDNQVKNLINDWQDAWENKDSKKISVLLAEDYTYEGKDKKNIRKQERLRSLEMTFNNYQFIEIGISNLKITEDPDSTGHMNAVFLQNYRSDKYSDTGNKILKLRKSTGSPLKQETKWEIYREYFE
jgi:ketosteroid isomerase-like protein